MTYETDGTLTTDKRTVDDSQTWDSQSDWEAYQSANNVTVTNGAVQLAEYSEPPSRVSRWPFEENTNDVWGSNDGNPQNAPTFTTDAQVGTYALQFNGSDQYVEIPNDASLQNPEFTLSAWVKGGGLQQDILCLESSGPWLKISTSDTDPVARATTTISGTTSDLDGTTDITDGNWYHIAATFNGSTVELYVNGSSEGSEAKSGDQEYTSENGTIGARSNQQYYWNGIIDDPRVYSKGLSSSEVSNLYNTGSING